MSIIEKAVDTLQNQARASGASDPLGVTSAVEDSADTVQKAARAQGTPARESTAQPREASPVGNGETRKPVIIPFDSLQQLGFLTPSIPRSAIAEEYRMIKRPLLTNIAGHSAAPIKNANLIMVTSALQGDGKTFNRHQPGHEYRHGAGQDGAVCRRGYPPRPIGGSECWGYPQAARA